MDDRRYLELLDTRAHRPERIREAADARRRRPLLGPTGRLFIIAADHPARGILGVGADPLAMADRRELLEWVLLTLEQPGVDGVLATPDIMEDLLLLGALDDRIAIGSMNRGGIAGSAWELYDRFTAYEIEGLRTAGLDGGKMLLRIDFDDPATADTLESCARSVTSLARAELLALVEPLPAVRVDGTWRISTDPDALIRTVSIASGLGATSAYTWHKLPVVEDMQRVIAATTCPVLLLGGDPGERSAQVFAGWKRALALPQTRGLVAGRTLLYPPDGDVAGAVAAAAALVHGR